MAVQSSYLRRGPERPSARRGLESVVRVATGVLPVGTTEVGTNFGWHAPWGEFRCLELPRNR